MCSLMGIMNFEGSGDDWYNFCKEFRDYWMFSYSVFSEVLYVMKIKIKIWIFGEIIMV